ncbi:MAG: hypothetical protein WBI00_06635, partial [Thermoanaerobaculia bacterium]
VLGLRLLFGEALARSRVARKVKQGKSVDGYTWQELTSTNNKPWLDPARVPVSGASINQGGEP